MSLKNLVELLKATAADWSEDNAARLAAALAYYSAISLAPLLVILVGIAGLVLGPEGARGEIAGQISGLIGPQGAEAVQDIIANASQPSSGVVATLIGIATLLWGASGVFGALQDGLDTIWEVTRERGRGIAGLIKDRFFSLTMVLGVGFLLMVSLLLSTALAAAGKFLGHMLPVSSWVLQILNFGISFGVITLLFALIYKVLPDAVIAWSDVWIGAAMTSLLFTIGKLLIGLYLGRSMATSAYGAAGSLIAILVWVYYSAQILFFGAEFTQVYANNYGARLRPAKNAVRATGEGARADEGIGAR